MRRSVLLLALVAACHDVPIAPPTPSAWQVTGNAQTGIPGYRLANQIVVRVADADGRPIVGDTIDFTPSDPFATVEPTTVSVTDSTGSAAVYWRLGGALGPQTLSAHSRVPGVSSTTMTATARSNNVTSIDGGDFGLCAVDMQGRFGCWRPPHLRTADVTTQFTAVKAPVHFTQVAMASIAAPYPLGPPPYAKGCVLADTGRPWCFTLDSLANVIGLAELAGAYPPLTQLVSSELVGASYCGLTGTGVAWCWGMNGNGQLGDGTLIDRAAPAAVATSVKFTQLDLGDRTACGLTAAGEAWCWGLNTLLQAGSAAGGAELLTPVAVSTALRFTRIRTLSWADATCGFVTGGGVYCWGFIEAILFGPVQGILGQLPDTANPVPVMSNPAVIDLVESYDYNVGYPWTLAFDRDAGIHYLYPGPSQTGIDTGYSLRFWLPIPASPAHVLSDMHVVHGAGFVCGPATFGAASLCESLARIGSDVEPAGGFLSRPAVVGVPFP